VLPMAIDIYSGGKVERKQIILDKAIQVFKFPAATRPDLVNVDAEKMLLCTKYDIKNTDEYLFQYNHAPLFLDRLEAVENIAAYQYENPAYRGLIETALNDKHWHIRLTAIDTLLIDDATSQVIKDKILDMAKNDSRSYVRSAAIEKLKDITGVDAAAVYNNALNDSSYNVVSTAMYAIYNNDKKTGLEIARKNKTQDNFNVSYAVMTILGESGEATDNGYFIENFKTASGYDSYFIMLNYEPFLMRMTDSYVINPGVDELKKIATENENFWMSFTASNILTGLVPVYEAAAEAETNMQVKQSLLSAIDYVNKAIAEITSSSEGGFDDY